MYQPECIKNVLTQPVINIIIRILNCVYEQLIVPVSTLYILYHYHYEANF